MEFHAGCLIFFPMKPKTRFIAQKEHEERGDQGLKS